jgi:hypothetical protein
MGVYDAIQQAIPRVADLEDADQEVRLKILKQLADGYKLGQLMDDVLTERQLLTTHKNLLSDPIGVRLLGIARARTADPEEAHALASTAAARLVTKFSSKYLVQARKNVSKGHFSKDAKNVGSDILDHQSDDGPPVTALRLPKWAPKIPSVVLERRLNLVYGNGGHDACAMVVFGYNVHLEKKPEEIVNDLGQLRISALASMLVQHYVRVVGADMTQHFSSLQRVASSGNSTDVLALHWDPLDIVVRWIKAAKAEQPTRFPERLISLFAEHLHYDAAKIVALLGGLTFDEIAARFVTEFSTAHNSLPHGEVVQRFVSDLETGRWGHESLRSSFDPRRTIGLWVDKINHALVRAEAAETAEGLVFLLNSLRDFPGNEILGFFFLQCLGEHAPSFADSCRHSDLSALRQECERRFCERFEANQEQKKVFHDAFRHLGHRILPDSGRTFASFTEGATLKDSLLAWRAKLFQAVPEDLRCGRIAPLFAWRFNLLNGSVAEKVVRSWS